MVWWRGVRFRVLILSGPIVTYLISITPARPKIISRYRVAGPRHHPHQRENAIKSTKTEGKDGPRPCVGGHTGIILETRSLLVASHITVKVPSCLSWRAIHGFQKSKRTLRHIDGEEPNGPEKSRWVSSSNSADGGMERNKARSPRKSAGGTGHAQQSSMFPSSGRSGPTAVPARPINPVHTVEEPS